MKQYMQTLLQNYRKSSYSSYTAYSTKFTTNYSKYDLPRMAVTLTPHEHGTTVVFSSLTHVRGIPTHEF